jgi:hypothetical protein
MARIPVAVMETIGFPKPWSMIYIAAFFVIGLAILKREWKIFWGMALAATFLPILPISDMMAARYVLLPALLLGLLCGWGMSNAERLSLLSVRGVVLVIPIFFFTGQLFWSNVMHWRYDLRRSLEQMRVEGEYSLTGGTADEFIRDPSGPSWFYAGLEWLRTHELKLPPGPRTFSDPVFFFENGKNFAQRIWQYDPSGKKLVEVRDFEKKLDALRGNLRLQAPLSLDLQFRESVVSWKAGPWETGAYAFVFNEREYFPIPRQGKRNVKLQEDLAFRLKYADPEGWVTYSTLLTLKVASGSGKLLWQR